MIERIKPEPKKEEILSVDDIYTPLEEAKEEIWKRWKDIKLRKKMEKYVGKKFFKLFFNKKCPLAIIGRNIASPNNELLYFIEKANKLGLRPLCFEYLDDKFVGQNSDKYYLANIYFFEGKGRNGGNKISTFKLIDVCKEDGKIFRDIKTLSGGSFVSFHHDFLDRLKTKCKRFDGSSWLHENGAVAKKYYYKYLALFAYFGILFEDFVTNKSEKKFLENIVIPHFKKVTKDLGVKPLIVELIGSSQSKDLYWRCYSKDIMKKVVKSGPKKVKCLI